ncbi:hypothetical protein [Hyalangium sp.]|uniref:hypothetical protein n=1 Tax=Hyalangium sp. TaxID=2028555 RepID=UPI002D2B31CD|nr:hypothetical protein [Hyalangium sp.]HYH96055.1 hypothetical protein [Hyalangium sp.]
MAALLFLPVIAWAQAAPHAHGSEPAPSPETMSVRDLPMTRNASGTAWQPDASPHTGLHWEAAGWDFMFHGLLFGGYDRQQGPRGDDALLGVGWLMLMAEREAGAALVGARVMLSPEPFTAQHNGGYPLLLQTGETYQGEPLRDRQHPHDLFMELAVTYTQALSRDWALQLYVAPAGEPALGPVAFPHRLSAASDPLAALGHHWQDSSHISFGVLTAGIVTPLAKLEASWFNGREPDEERRDLDLRKLDSYSLRLSVNPTREVSAQVSYGFMPSHSVLHADEPLHRLTASATLHRPLGSGGLWATTAVFGRNVESEHGGSNAYLLETNLDLDGHNVVFGRAEYIQKTGHDLVLPEPLEEETFGVASLTLGYLRNFGPLGPVQPGLGLRAAVNFLPEGLESTYGSRLPVGGMVYLRLSSAPSERTGHGGSHSSSPSSHSLQISSPGP